MLLILILILVLIIIKLFFNYKKENFDTELPDTTIAYEVALIEANAAEIANKQAEASLLSSTSIAKAASAAALASSAISTIATNQANKNKEIADKIALGNNNEEIDEANAAAKLSAAVAKSAATASAAANAISKVTSNKVTSNKLIAEKKNLETKEAADKVIKTKAAASKVCNTDPQPLLNNRSCNSWSWDDERTQQRYNMPNYQKTGTVPPGWDCWYEPTTQCVSIDCLNSSDTSGACSKRNQW